MRNTVIGLIVAIMLFGCSQGDPPRTEFKRQLQTYRVTSEKIQSYIEMTGTVQPDLEGGAKIVSPLQGVVERIFIKIGEGVKKGTSLAMLRSSEASDAYSSYLSTLSQLKQAERIYHLNKGLFEVGAITRNDLLNSEASHEQAKALSGGLKKKLDIYGASSEEAVHGQFIIKAPIDGHVVDIQAHIGDRFDTSTPLMVIANPQRVMVVANIYDTDLPRIPKGKKVTFSTDIFPDKNFNGIVSYISDVEDPDTKTIKAYIRILERGNLFKQNMFLKIKMLDGEKSLPVIPKTACLYKDGKFYVSLKKDGGKIELKEIKTIRDSSNKTMAVEGLSEGDEIIYSAIDLEKP